MSILGDFDKKDSFELIATDLIINYYSKRGYYIDREKVCVVHSSCIFGCFSCTLKVKLDNMFCMLCIVQYNSETFKYYVETYKYVSTLETKLTDGTFIDSFECNTESE